MGVNILKLHIGRIRQNNTNISLTQYIAYRSHVNAPSSDIIQRYQTPEIDQVATGAGQVKVLLAEAGMVVVVLILA